MNKKLRTIIIDDEKLARELVKNFLKKVEDKLELVAECRDGFEGVKAVSEHKPDLIFLDIQMPKLNGFEMLELLDEQPKVIFTTAYDEYAIKAFEVNAVDYLLKPFSEERFAEAVTKAGETGYDGSDKINRLIETIPGKEKLERIAVRANQKIQIIPVEKIRYLEAQDDYVMIHAEQGRFLKTKTMKYFEENLDSSKFVRVHRSYIANLEYMEGVELLEKETYRLKLINGGQLPVSRTGYGKLKEILDEA